MSLANLARHEAAHAVACIHRGVMIRSAEIRPDGTGEVQHALCGPGDLMFMALASGEFDQLSQSDVDQVNAEAWRFHGPEKYSLAIEDTHTAVIAWAADPNVKRSVERVAQALLGHWRLSGAEVYELLGIAPPAERVCTDRSGPGSRLMDVARRR